MFDYVMIVLVTVFITSILTEQMVMKRLQMSEGVSISNGRCRLVEGYGKIKKE